MAAQTFSTRRALLGSAGSLTLAVPIIGGLCATVAPCPSDLARIALELDRLEEVRVPLEAAWEAHALGPNSPELTRIADAMDPIDHRYMALEDEVIPLKAHTMMELGAKARILRNAIMFAHATHHDPATVEEPGLTLALSLCDDLERLDRQGRARA